MSALVTLGDILKSEADPKSRIAITAPKGTKIGQLVKYALRKQYLVALSDEEHGKVLVQPHNCVIDLSHTVNAEIEKLKTGEPEAKLTVEKLKSEGDAHGILYIGQPIT